ncbi:MAG: hypothetical protein AAGA33_00210 [Pseudomonadota bacterium]
MTQWPSILRRQSDPRDATVLWDSGVYFFCFGLPVLLVFAFLDQTEINGEPRWIKPIKFFLSLAVYNLNLEWLYRVFRTDDNVARLNRVRWIIAVGLLLEALLIVVQAARGVQSHFNVATPLDSAIFSIMGVTITIVVLAALYSGFIIWRARHQAPAIIAEATVLAILVMTVGSFQGFSMTSPTPEQLAALQQGGDFLRSGTHHVGQPSGDQHDTVPLVDWSLDVGDLRIPHFIGLHALQFFLVLAFLLYRFKLPAQFAIVRLFAVSYGGLFVYAFLRALGGAPLI